MQGEGKVQGEPRPADHALYAGKLNGKFGAGIIVHIVYDNQESAAVAGHKQQAYATARVTSPKWFKDKETFMGLICSAFESFYDSLKVDHGSGGDEGKDVRQGASDKA